MSLIVAAFLGLVQGITEFLPISSSGHLVIAEKLLGTTVDFEFDVLLNIGTLLALLLFYRKRILDLLLKSKRNLGYFSKLIAAIIPTFAIGFVFSGFFETLNEEIWIVIVMLTLIGIVMIVFGQERKEITTPEAEKISWKQSTMISIAQVAALVPGTSRSGITILAGLSQKLSASAAAEFSFMLAIPTIMGATAKVALSGEGRDFFANNIGAVVVGNIASFVSGIVAVSFLIRILSTRGLYAFGYYRIALASILAILVVSNTI